MDGRTLAKLRTVTSTGKLRPYDRFGKLVPDMEWLPLSGEFGSDYECFLVKFKPGATSQPHEHTGGEEFMVLEGSLEDSDGTRFEAGDFVSYPVGSRHSSHAPDGCLLLVIVRGPNRLLNEEEAKEVAAAV